MKGDLMDETNQNDPVDPTPADQALPPQRPPAEPAVNQTPTNQTPSPQSPPTEAPADQTPNNQVSSGYDQSAPPTQPQQPVEPSVEAQMNTDAGQAPEAPADRPKKSIWGWIIGLIIIVIVGVAIYYFYFAKT